MSASSHILGSSISGSIELLTLCSAGAYLVSAGILDRRLTRRLSKATKDMFIPCLVFVSILHTTHSAIETLLTSDESISALQQIWVPILLAFLVLGVGAAFAFPITRVIAADKQESVRRAIFLCLTLGNANVLPLLVMQSLCDTFPPLMETPQCYEKSMGYASLFLTIVNIISWMTLYQYLRASPDNVVGTLAAEEDPLLQEEGTTGVVANGDGAAPEEDFDEQDGFAEAVYRAFNSPIFLSMIAAVVIAITYPISSARNYLPD
eukprot:gb/GEZJ01002725.1/.p1 GENE.gb/GEZJ01002725.1/~~gb/GEZJ01002725.1/.p1  ORF type:complete len:264 (-),score=28.88 gb/GEZJ01002725.1/:1241-2032(-)